MRAKPCLQLPSVEHDAPPQLILQLTCVLAISPDYVYLAQRLCAQLHTRSIALRCQPVKFDAVCSRASSLQSSGGIPVEDMLHGTTTLQLHKSVSIAANECCSPAILHVIHET